MNEKQKTKLDKPASYHTFLTSHKVFETPFQFGYGFLVELECGHIIQLVDTTPKEKELKKIFCPQCKVESNIIQPEEHFYKEILRYRRVKI